MVKISSDSIFKNINIFGKGNTWRHVVGGNFRHNKSYKLFNLFRVLKSLIINFNVGNVYTNIQVYNKLSF
jgi:hypothetical protein